MNKEALFYVEHNGKIQCHLCPHMCKLNKGESGLCGVRRNIDGKLISMSYSTLTAIASDPIEKKPLRMFMPGTKTLSIGSYGCNLRCPWCQNFNISQNKPSYTRIVLPQEIISMALNNDYPSISLTYNEPLINYEYALEIAKLAREKNLKTILVTAAHINKEPWEELIPYIDAMNIDLKCFNKERFRIFCQGDLDAVKDAISYASTKTHVEITTLIVPDFNDDLNELDRMFKWISKIDRAMPIHIARYFPRYHFRKSATEVSIMEKIRELANNSLDNIYLGNV